MYTLMWYHEDDETTVFLTSISRISFPQALIVSHLIAADRLRRHPDMWEENSYFLWEVALPKPQDASRIALRDLWLACWYSWCFISCSIPKKRSGAATVALSTTDSVSCWAQSLTGLSNCFHYSQRRQKAIPGLSHLNINTVGTVGWVHGLHWAPVSVCHGSSTSYTVQSLQLPSLFKATSYAPILASWSIRRKACLSATTRFKSEHTLCISL